MTALNMGLKLGSDVFAVARS